MPTAQETTTQISVESNATQNHNFLSPDVHMLILTWVTFFSLLAVLYKFAWKPILSALERREGAIRKSLEEAQKIKDELARINETCRTILAETEVKSKAILAESRKEGVGLAKGIHEKAKEEAAITLENARREIKTEVEKAQANLREESARVAVGLASKLIEQNLDTQHNKKLVEEFLKKI